MGAEAHLSLPVPLMLVLLSLLSSAGLACVNAASIQLGRTTLVGRDITPFQQEFFGGSARYIDSHAPLTVS